MVISFLLVLHLRVKRTNNSVKDQELWNTRNGGWHDIDSFRWNEFFRAGLAGCSSSTVRIELFKSSKNKIFGSHSRVASFLRTKT